VTSPRQAQPPTSAIEIVRCIYDAIEDGDTRTPRNYFREDVEAYVSEFVPWGGSFHGLDAFSEGFLTLTRHVRIAFEPSELIDAGEYVIALGRSVGIVHRTGRTFSVRTVHVWKLEDEKVTSVAYYHDHELATHLADAAA
jgi:ketosteroid isomerase-like protein